MFDLQNPQHLRERADALEAPEGTPIEIETDSGWLLVNEPIWAAHQRYRVKPTPEPLIYRAAKRMADELGLGDNYYLLADEDILRAGDESKDINVHGRVNWRLVGTESICEKVGVFPSHIFRRKTPASARQFSDPQHTALQAIADAYEQGWRPKLPDCAEARHPDYQLPPLPDDHRFLKRHEYIQPGDLQWFGDGQGLGWQAVITSTLGLRYPDNGSCAICRKKQTV